ncbi:MAG: ATP synthase F0 subunit C [Planctomycetes bacterium]|nr:ATP synthase F0 subunit C [Planctomycetota bacterium]
MDLLVSLVTLVQDAAKTEVFDFGLNNAAAAIGAGLCIIGGAFGISRLAAAAMEGISRQPEAAGEIRGGMLLAAALIEGVTLLAIITCMLAIFM